MESAPDSVVSADAANLQAMAQAGVKLASPEPRAPTPEPAAFTTEPQGLTTESQSRTTEPQAPMPQPRIPTPEPRVPSTEPRAASDNGASTKPTSIGTAATSKTNRSPATFDGPENLPDEDALLRDEEIHKLFRQSTFFRKKYGEIFTSAGKVRKPYYGLIFERLPDGQLRHEEPIIQSNVLHWRDALRHFENPDKYDAKGNEKGKEEESVHKPKAAAGTSSRKRKRASTDDTESGNAGQSQAIQPHQIENESLTTANNRPQSSSQVKPSIPMQNSRQSLVDLPGLTATSRQAVSTAPRRFLSLTNDLNLLSIDGLSDFTRFIDAEFDKLKSDLMQARAAGKTKEWQKREITLMIQLLHVQMACLDWEEELNKVQVGQV